ncbi:flippase-like domain-containing protein [Rhodoferax sp. 4810]|nr:flippase-like domain-containing protein [Rhodoferax jenense]
MKLRGALLGFAALTLIYVLVLLWLDARNHVFQSVPRLALLMPSVMGLSLLSYGVRYIRWHWLLRRAGHQVPAIWGMLAYLTGFAFTATPGKIGELVRIRYFAQHGVPAPRVIAAFVFERAFDLIAVLVLGLFAVASREIFVTAFVFVMLFLTLVMALVAKPQWLIAVQGALLSSGWPRLAGQCAKLCSGLDGLKLWLTLTDIGVVLGLGLLAWGLSAYSLVMLVGSLGIVLPLPSAIGLYPLAMLAGAASMLPGGVGTTEVTLALMLGSYHVPADLAVLAAVGIRIASLWFSIACGLTAITVLEMTAPPSDKFESSKQVG